VGAGRKTDEVRGNYNLASIVLETSTKKAGQEESTINVNKTAS